MSFIFSLFCAVFLLMACKPVQVTEAGEKSITLKDSPAGKWVATLSIGGGIPTKETLRLANVIRETFGSPLAGNYMRGFHIDDKSGERLTKALILDQFSKLRNNIRAYKQKNPGAPTMLVLGLTGHGFGRAALSEFRDEYMLVVNNSSSEFKNPDDFFTGRELAQLIASLEVNETLVFVQSCFSGDFAKVSLLNQYSAHLAQEANRIRTNIAVITPVHELLVSPANGIEPIIESTFRELHAGVGDVATYAMFKDTLMRKVCESKMYLPRSAIVDASAVGPSALAGRSDLSMGIEPQFFENVSPNLPLILTAQGLKKWETKTLALPPQSAKIQHVPLSKSTFEFCEQSKLKSQNKFTALESERVKYKNIYLKCKADKDPVSCFDANL